MKTKLLILLISLLFFIDAQAQCAMCRAVLETDQSGNAAQGMNQGIVYLMLFPYIMVGIIGFMVYKSRKNNK